ncbi:hypothetical protein HDU84_007593 [Entophlyctis sp. JEL0112]|nr:hypothetical protein HDU84_007593 [Entophlyctis sp. JEL0112]
MRNPGDCRSVAAKVMPKRANAGWASGAARPLRVTVTRFDLLFYFSKATTYRQMSFRARLSRRGASTIASVYGCPTALRQRPQFLSGRFRVCRSLEELYSRESFSGAKLGECVGARLGKTAGSNEQGFLGADWTERSSGSFGDSGRGGQRTAGRAPEEPLSDASLWGACAKPTVGGRRALCGQPSFTWMMDVGDIRNDQFESVINCRITRSSRMASIAFLPVAAVTGADLDFETAVAAADSNHYRKSRGSDPADPRIVSGHLGVTPAFVQGYVRVIVDPDFSAAHAHLVTRPTLSIKLRGFVRAAKGSSSILLRKTPLRSLQWADKIIMDQISTVTDAFDLGIRAESDLCVLLPGTYDVPFCFDLPNTLPPTFAGYDGKVWYTLSVTMKFKEDHNGGYSFFEKSFSQPVIIRYVSKRYLFIHYDLRNRRYNSDHIINQQETAELHPSLAVSPFFDVNDLENVQSPTPRPMSIRSDYSSQRRSAALDFNPASMSPPIQSLDTISTRTGNLGTSSGVAPVARLRRTRTGEFSIASENFGDPATYSNLDSADPIRYHVVIPNRSFGPDDPIVVNLHISKLPEGFEIHHVDVIVRASITQQSPKGPITTTQVLMRHRDIPESSGSFWNRKINVSSVKLFRSPRKSPSLHFPETREMDLIGTVGDVTQQSGEGGNDSNQRSAVTEQPPPFEEVVPDLNVPRTYGLSRRTALLQTLAGQSRSSARSESPIPVAYDAGISVGNSAVFQPWTFQESGRRDSISTGGIHLARSLSSRFLTGMGRHTPVQSVRSVSIRPRSHVSSDGEQSEDDEASEINDANSDEVVDETQTNGSGSFPGSSWNLSTQALTRSHAESVQSARQTSGMNRSLSVPIANTNVGTNDSPVPAATPPASSIPPLPRAMLPSRQQHAPLAYEQENTMFQEQLHAPTQQKTPVQRIFDISQRILGFKPKSNADDGPLSTFTTPYVSVKHTLRVEISCHKPLLLGVGSQPIFLSQSNNTSNSANGARASSEANSNDLNNMSGDHTTQSSGSGLFRKVVPLGFRFTTAIETPVVVHTATGRDKQFLQSYLYGPPRNGSGTEDRSVGVTAGAAVVNYVGEVAPAYER